jgi:hypothetical protein
VQALLRGKELRATGFQRLHARDHARSHRLGADVTPGEPAISAGSPGVWAAEHALGSSCSRSACGPALGRDRCEAPRGPRVEIPGRGVR